MHTKQPLKEILSATRDQWDNDEVRPAVRRNFQKMIECRTSALGAEVYASEEEKKVVYHTCKSRACPSCGHRATQLWQREQWAALPDIPYAGVVLTMPDVLWPFFHENRHLLHDLPALGAAVIQQWIKVRFGVRVLIMVVPHTFGRRLNFNVHLHILVSAVGLCETEGRLKKVRLANDPLMSMWRYAVITYLREALAKKVLRSEVSTEELKAVLRTQYERWWNINIAHFHSKSHFLRYAGRYVRHPPIAEHRFIGITNQAVKFSTKDLKQKRVVETRYSLADFVINLAEHVPDHYRHAIRYFGLWAPRSKAQTYQALFLLLGQKKRPRPRRLKWADAIGKTFGRNPLLDRVGRRMHWIGRLKPNSSNVNSGASP
jgi:hypothetical protein